MGSHHQKRVRAAVQRLQKQIDHTNAQAQRRTVNVYDTGVGGSEHSRRIEQRREQNARVDRGAATISSIVRDLIEKLERTANESEVWRLVVEELRIYTHGHPDCYRSKEEGGGVNWQKVWAALRASPFNDSTGQATVTALSAIYHCFFK